MDKAQPESGHDILVIEDDRLVAETIRLGWPVPADRLRFLSTYRQSILIVQSAEISSYDGVIIDIRLPDGDGLTILRTIRGNTDIPIILISGQGTAASRADAIDLGADDYVMKPFNVRELQARMARLVRVRLAKTGRERRHTFMIGDIRCDLQNLTISLGDKTERITDTEARLLEYLYLNRNRNCGRDELYKSVMFRPNDFTDRTLEVYMSRVRKKIADFDTPSSKLLQTVRGFGYRLAEP
jgi:DNA-binding response OmpR family regulator